MATASPVIAQWLAAKEQQPDALLFFRMGDFYELFFDDAAVAADALGIALTARGEHDGKPIAMCGVPIHAAEGYLARLIRRGFRVAVAEQMEAASARTGKAPLKREIVRLVTPGTLTEDSLLDGGRPNLLLALARAGRPLGAAWLDISTGLFETEAVGDLPALLGRLDPAEILAPLDLRWATTRTAAPPSRCRRRHWPPAPGWRRRSARPRWTGSAPSPTPRRWPLPPPWPMSARPRPASCPRCPRRPATMAAARWRWMPRPGPASRSPAPGTARPNTRLLASVDRTVTPPGARLLAAWLSAPLTDAAAIAARQDGWMQLLARPARSRPLRTVLRGAPDATRALGRLSVGRGGPRDLLAVRNCSRWRPRLRRVCCACRRGPLAPATLGAETGWPTSIPTCASTRPGLPGRAAAPRRCGWRMAAPSPRASTASSTRERRLRDDSRRVVTGLQLDYAQRYGVASLKIRHHAQLGYVMEVPAAAADALKARPELSLRQSMANAARFTNPELADLDRRINDAAGRAGAREAAIFDALAPDVLARAQALRRAAAAWPCWTCCRAAPAWPNPAPGAAPSCTGHRLLRHRRPPPGGGGGAARPAPRSSPTTATCRRRAGCCC